MIILAAVKGSDKMRQRRSSLGFTVLELLLVAAVVGLIGLVGYKIYNTQKENDKVANNTDAILEQALAPNAAVPAISSANDLEQVEKTLADYDSSAQDDKDLSQLDSELAAF